MSSSDQALALPVAGATSTSSRGLRTSSMPLTEPREVIVAALGHILLELRDQKQEMAEMRALIGRGPSPRAKPAAAPRGSTWDDVLPTARTPRRVRIATDDDIGSHDEISETDQLLTTPPRVPVVLQEWTL